MTNAAEEKKANLIFDKWKAELKELDRSRANVESNFDALFLKLKESKISFDVAHQILSKAIIAHHPNQSVIDNVYRRVKISGKPKQEFADEWKENIAAGAKRIFYSLYDIDGVEKDEPEEEKKEYGSMSASVIKATDKFKQEELGLIIFDEVHHIAASTFFDIAAALGDVGRVYGLTATDYRSDGKDIMINAGCGKILLKRDIKWGITNGFLAIPKFIVKNVATTGSDYKHDKLKNYKEHILNNTIMKNQILKDIQDYIAQGKSVLCLVGETAHGEELSKQLGLPFAQGTDKQSQSYVNQLNAGIISGLIGTGGRIGEGTDTKNVDVLIMAQFIASKGPVVQALGRALRKQGVKTEAIIIDYVPQGSSMLSRHTKSRIDWYKEITNDVSVI